MKAQTILTLLEVLGGTGVLAHGQSGIGKTYHARDPSVCKSMNEPARGAPSASQARDYIRCANEKIMGSGLLLYENVQVEVGKSRPYSAGADSGAGEIDPLTAGVPGSRHLGFLYLLGAHTQRDHRQEL